MKRLVLGLLLLAAPAQADTLFNPVSLQAVTVSGTEAVTGVLENGTDMIRIVCTAACTVATATTNLTTTASQPTYLPANVPAYLKKNPATSIPKDLIRMTEAIIWIGS